MTEIENKISEIKRFSGIELTTCDYFSGLQLFNGNKYFNVVIETRVSESIIYGKLINMIPFGLFTKIEPNGLNRIAIFF